MSQPDGERHAGACGAVRAGALRRTDRAGGPAAIDVMRERGIDIASPVAQSAFT
ncbi:hypothetical protein [Burkholderia sp. NLJ2]|uniref:hypothetical protein n=1 Tax=Burkholderia sp. NLJ2 TaxID=3090699 RepID=UPI003C6BFF75